MLTRATKRHLATFKRSPFCPTNATWEIVLSNDSLYPILQEWRWIWVLAQVSHTFADALLPLRTRIMRLMCEGDKAPILWRTKARELFALPPTLKLPLLMHRGDILPTRPFQDINEAFLLAKSPKRKRPAAQISRLHHEEKQLEEEMERQKAEDRAAFEAERARHEEEYQRQTAQEYGESEVENLRDHAEYEREKQRLDIQYKDNRTLWHIKRLEAIKRLHDRGVERIARLAAKGQQRLALWQEKRAQCLAATTARVDARNALRRERRAYFAAKLKQAHEDQGAPHAASMAKTLAGAVAFPMIYDRVIGKRLRI